MEINKYIERFKKSCEFSKENNFKIDTEESVVNEKEINDFVNELTEIIPGLLQRYPGMGFHDVITRFGGDCGTAHFSIFQFAKQYYPDLPVNITLGEVNHDEITYFNFDEKKCNDWLYNGAPEIFDCHAWITIGRDIILDVTIGTYLNTRVDSSKQDYTEKEIYGGVLLWRNGSFEYYPIKGIKNSPPVNVASLDYSPVIVGEEAMKSVAPLQP